MSEWLVVLLIATGAGLSVPVGAALASLERVRPDWLEAELRHSIIAFGGSLQNLPEAFNAYREIDATTRASSTRILITFSAIALLGPVAALTGFFALVEMKAVVAAIMLFASGGILYLVFQDIAPQARLERHWAPPLAALMPATGDLQLAGTSLQYFNRGNKSVRPERKRTWHCALWFLFYWRCIPSWRLRPDRLASRVRAVMMSALPISRRCPTSSITPRANSAIWSIRFSSVFASFGAIEPTVKA